MHNLSKWTKINFASLTESGKGEIEKQCYISLQKVYKFLEDVENQ